MRSSNTSCETSPQVLIPCFPIDHDLLESLSISSSLLRLLSTVLSLDTISWFRTYADIDLTLQHDVEIVTCLALMNYALAWFRILVLQVLAYFQQVTVFDFRGSLFEKLELRYYRLDFLVELILSPLIAGLLQNLNDLLEHCSACKESG